MDKHLAYYKKPQIRHARDKHINYGHKKLYNIAPWCQAKLSNDLFLNGKNFKFLN
jgi:hypothetical protein